MHNKKFLFLSLLIPFVCSCSIQDAIEKFKGSPEEAEKAKEEFSKDDNNKQDEEKHIDSVETNAQSQNGTFTNTNISYRFESSKVYATCHDSTDENKTIDLEFGNVFLNNSIPKFQKNSYFTFGNAIDSPLNSIDEVHLQLKTEPNSRGIYDTYYGVCTIAFYYSYHYLTLNNIFNGKYRDLYCDVVTADPYEYMPINKYAPNADRCLPRYFLAVVQTPDVDLSTSEIQIISEAENAPSAIPFEDFLLPKYLKEDEVELVNKLNLCINGSIDFFGENGILILFQKTGILNLVKGILRELGYTQMEEGIAFKTVEFDRAIAFQKNTKDNYYSTIFVNYKSFGGFESVGMYEEECLGQIQVFDYWPEAELQSVISNQELKDHLDSPVGTVSSNIKFVLSGYEDSESVDWIINLEIINLDKDEIANIYASIRAFYEALKADTRYNTHISGHDYNIEQGYCDNYCRSDAISQTNDLYAGIYIAKAWRHVELYFIYSQY